MVACIGWQEAEQGEFHYCVQRSKNGALHLLAEIEKADEPTPHFEWTVIDFFDSDRVFACGDALNFEQAKVMAEAHMSVCAQIGHTSNR